MGRPEDVERAAEKLLVARVKNEEQFERAHRPRPKKVEEGDWVLVYDNNLDNQHKAMRKFVTRWFEPYVVTRANDNGTYHLAELDGTRTVVPMAEKRIKSFKKRHEDEPDLASVDDNDNQIGEDGGSKDER